MFKKKEGSAAAPATNREAPPAQAPSAFHRFAGAPSRTQGNYISAGTYIVEVEEMTEKKSLRPATKGHEIIIASLTILDVVTAYDAEGAEWKASNRRGERVSFIQDLSHPERGDLAASNLKNFMLACGRCDVPDLTEADVTPEEWVEILAKAVEPPGHAMRGKRLLMYAVRKPTSKGRPFVAVSFEPYVEPEIPATESGK